MKSLAMLATPVVLLMMWAGRADCQADGSFWWLRKTTGAPAEPEVTTIGRIQEPPRQCECVKYYLCINGTISTSGVGIIDVRLGGHQPPPPPPPRNRASNQCSDLYDVCCFPPMPDTTTSPVTTTTPQPTLPPDTPCECVSFINCTGDRIVSDGKGNTSLEAFGIYASHSSCPHAFSVCCALEPTTTPATPVVTSSTRAPSHPHCDCVEPFQCDETGTIVTSGAGLLDLRSLYPNPNPGIECENPRMICCNLPPSEYHGTNTSANLTATMSTQGTTTESSGSNPPNCGSRNQNGIVARILGFQGGESQFGEFPWVAAILRREFVMEKQVHLFVGGGTLIHSRIVITAAHKISGIRADKLWVRLGEWDTQTQLEAYDHQNVQVEEIVIHPDFNPKVLFNDIALLILKEEVIRAPHINHICLAEKLSQIDPSNCVINGWGKDGFEDTGTFQTIMKSLTLPLVDSNKCQQQLRRSRLGPYFRLHESFVCAGGELGKDACTGDGGGPLACSRSDDPTRYLLVGMVAWGIGCGQDGLPGVYASIPANYNWILNETYGRYPSSTTTTPMTTTTSTTTTPLPATLEIEAAYIEEEYGYEDWEDDRSWQDLEKERRKKQRKEQRKREREERKRRREERRRQREYWREWRQY